MLNNPVLNNPVLKMPMFRGGDFLDDEGKVTPKAAHDIFVVMQGTMLKCFEDPRLLDRMIDKARWSGIDPIMIPGGLHSLTTELPHCKVVVWDIDIWNMVNENSEAFEDTPLQESTLDGDRHFWLIHKPLTVRSDSETGRAMDIPRDCYLMGIYVGAGIPISTVNGVKNNEMVVAAIFMEINNRPGSSGDDAFVPIIRHSPSIGPGDMLRGLNGSVATGLKFLKMPFIGTDRHHFSRPERRRFMKADKKVPDIVTVVLRRSESRPGQNPEPGDPSTNRYTCQFMVKGFFRKQWYPSQGVHKPIWIEPFIKGPEGAPMKALKPTVYLAKR